MPRRLPEFMIYPVETLYGDYVTLLGGSVYCTRNAVSMFSYPFINLSTKKIQRWSGYENR